MDNELSYRLMPFACPDVPVALVPRPYQTEYGVQKMMSSLDATRIIEEFALAPSDDWLDLSNFASALYVSQRDLEALVVAQRVATLERNSSTLLNLAIILETFSRFDEAFVIIEEAYRMDPNNELVGSTYSDALIRFGRWEDGWPLHEHYHADWGWLTKLIPLWDGPHQRLAGKSILVLDGGGFGDNLIFLRWMERLKQEGARVSYVCPYLLAPLLAGNKFIDEIIPNHNYQWSMNPSDFDYFVPILGLAHRFGATAPMRLWHGPYIFADLAKSKLRAMCLDRASGIPLVGICTKAGEAAYPRKYKTLTKNQSRRLLHASTPAGIQWISLQYDEPLPTEDKVIVFEPAIKDWSDTAAIIDNLDLVITVDTGVAHLAGAMGKPTLLMLPGRSSWPFLLGRSDSPFYPSMRIFRNESLGLDHAVNETIDALAEFKVAR